MLKVALAGEGWAEQVATLERAAGRGYVRLLRSDLRRRAVLLEDARPVAEPPAAGHRARPAALPGRHAGPGLAGPGGRPGPPPGPGQGEPGWPSSSPAPGTGCDRPCSERVVDQALGVRRAAGRRGRTATWSWSTATRIPATCWPCLSPRPGAETGYVFVDPDGFVADRAYDLGVALRDWSSTLLGPDARRVAEGYCAVLAERSGVDATADLGMGVSRAGVHRSVRAGRGRSPRPGVRGPTWTRPSGWWTELRPGRLGRVPDHARLLHRRQSRLRWSRSSWPAAPAAPPAPVRPGVRARPQPAPTAHQPAALGTAAPRRPAPRPPRPSTRCRWPWWCTRPGRSPTSRWRRRAGWSPTRPNRWSAIGQPGGRMRVVSFAGRTRGARCCGPVRGQHATCSGVLPAAAVDPSGPGAHRRRPASAARPPGLPAARCPAAEPVPEVTTLTVVGDIMLARRVGRAIADDPRAPVPAAGQPAGAGRHHRRQPRVDPVHRRRAHPGRRLVRRPARACCAGSSRPASTLVSLANNHVGDYGDRAMRQTFDRLRAADLPYVGAGRNLAEARRPVVITRDGVRIGFLGTDSIGETPAAASRRAGTNRLNMPPRTGPLDRAALDRITADIRSAQAHRRRRGGRSRTGAPSTPTAPRPASASPPGRSPRRGPTW